MVTRVTVQPELLRWAVDRSGLSYGDFREPVDAWIRGESQPTLRKLEAFARKAMVPFGYLFLQDPPEEPIGIPDFRTFRDEKLRTFSPNLRDSLTDIQRRQAWMRDHLIDLGSEPLPFVGSLERPISFERAATLIRERLDLPDDWQTQQRTWELALTALRLSIEEAGVFVCMTNQVGLNTRRSLDPNEFRGFVLIDEYAPWIFVNTNDTKSAQMFTLAHEMVHIWVGKPGLFNLEKLAASDDGIEQFCNRVAAEFLLPRERFLSEWTKTGALRDRCVNLARVFKVSPLVVGRRAFELELISRTDFFTFYQEQMEQWRDLKALRKAEKKPIPVFWQQQDLRLGGRFGQAVAQAYAERKLLPSEARDLTGFSRDAFSKYADAKLLQRFGASE
ncbi:ImmA/IrrE family metallo-endopeptidase [Rosistilla oblonga]|uniref:ImmA/IrrE family metallo-endopeptidase n=1 Tax=Rosistilla oblonga TaxID=2527990 RepID=UPI003A983FF9